MSARQPVVSVIVPVFNKAEYLDDALASARSQSLKDIEIIVVDDGSADGSLEAAERVAEVDPRVRVFSQANAGVAAARNRGLIAASGTFVAFLDPDDWYPDDEVLEDLVRAAEDNNLPIAGGGAEKYVGGRFSQNYPRNESGYLFQQDGVVEYRNYQFDYGFWRFIYDRSFLIENGIFFPPYRRYQDPPFFVRAMSLAGRFVALRRSTYVYRVAQSTNWQPAKVVDVLRGMIDVLRFAAESEYHDLAERTLRRFNAAHIQAALVEVLNTTPERVEPALEVFTDLTLRYGSTWQGGERPFVRTAGAGEPDGPLDISVIVPVYNSAAWLHECLLSVLGQNGVNLEIICVDDGSTDDSIRILREYQDIDPRVKVIQQANGGLSVARNTGIAAARGRYMCFLDSDDYWRLDGIAKLVRRADEDSLDLLQYDAVPFAGEGASAASWRQYVNYYKRTHEQKRPIAGAELIASQLGANDYKPSACLYIVRTSHIAGLNLRFVPSMTHEDNPFTFAALMNTDRAAHMAVDLYARRVRPDSIMTSDSLEASMRGYFISYVNMHREVMKHTMSAVAEREIGVLLGRILDNVSSRYSKVGTEARTALADLATSPEGLVAYSMLQKIQQLRDAAPKK